VENIFPFRLFSSHRLACSEKTLHDKKKLAIVATVGLLAKKILSKRIEEKMSCVTTIPTLYSNRASFLFRAQTHSTEVSNA